MKEFTQQFISVILFIVLILSCSQEPNPKNDKIETDNTEKIKFYLLGTFHFAQTDSTYNVLDENHQKSIEALCDIIAKQKPDKIFVERQPEYEFRNKIDSLYENYVKSFEPLNRRNEIFQVGFRTAKKLGHKKLFQCDHPGQYGRFNSAVIEYATNNNQTDVLELKD